MKYFTFSLTSLCLTSLCLSAVASAEDAAKTEPPLKVLLVAGGCCHDYETQTKLLKDGIEERIAANVTVVFNPSKTTETTFEIYENDNWAEGYDVVIHDECSANVTEKPYVQRILKAHRDGVPAVNLHCAMHSYRWGNYREPVEPGSDNAGWYEMIGVQSSAHGPKTPIDINFDASNPITKGFKPWTTIDEELYNNMRIYDGTEALAVGNQMTKPNKKQLKKNPNAKPKESSAAVVWINRYGPKQTRIFSTSLGHQNETVGDDRYLDLVSNGLLWAAGRIGESK